MIVQTADRIILGASARVRLTLDEVRCLLLAASPVDDGVLDEHGVCAATVKALIDQGLLSSSPEPSRDLWWQYGWERGWDFMAAVAAQRAARRGPRERHQPVALQDDDDVAVLMRRRSYRLFEPDPVPGALAEAVRATVTDAAVSDIEAHLVVQAVEGIDSGVYRLAPGASHDMEWRYVRPVDEALLLDVAQGMWWIEGGGAILFLSTRGAPSELDYFETLLAVGRIGQRVLLDVYRAGLGAWQTPALDEAKATALLALDGAEPLEMIKFGVPRADELMAYAGMQSRQ